MSKILLNNIANSLRQRKLVNIDGETKYDICKLVNVSRNDSKLSMNLSKSRIDKINTVRAKMREQIENGVAIYGTTTAYGGRANLVFTDIKKQRLSNAKKLSRAIVHVDVSTGEPLPIDLVRGAMSIRINMLLSGHSAVRIESLEEIRKLINNNITPIVGSYGTVGASGDLAQNGRVLSTLLQIPDTKVYDKNGNVVEAKKILQKVGMKPLILDPKEGLGLVNGDNFSTAAAALIVYDLTCLMIINSFVAALTIQALKGSTRNYHPLLSKVRPHPGQEFTADILLELLNDSRLAYQELSGPVKRKKGEIVQDVYSIRCLPQYYGPDWETLSSVWKTIETNMNSVSDNPLWTTPDTATDDDDLYQWVSGGNFLAMHMSDAIDKMRKVAVHIVKQNDRHLARLIHPELNNGLPANLSHKSAISQTTFKGLQTQMGMYEVYASVLATPVSTSFGVHEELNQDITSHALTSALMTHEVLKITKYAIATNFIAACQAIDLRGGVKLLSSKTVPHYEWLREIVPFVKKERPMASFVENVSSKLLESRLLELCLKQLYE